MEWTNKLYDLIYMAIDYLGTYGPLFACLLIVIESIIPILPLMFFITINFLAFGKITGFIVSWVFTIIGCLISFILFRKGVRKWFTERLRMNVMVNKFMNIFDDIKPKHLVLLIAIPFTPAFAINIAAGLSKMSIKKFIVSLIIGKMFMVYFWGFVGTSLIQSLTNPKILLQVFIACAIAYIIGSVLNKKIEN